MSICELQQQEKESLSEVAMIHTVYVAEKTVQLGCKTLRKVCQELHATSYL